MKKFKFLAFVAVIMMIAACSEPLDEAAECTPPSNDGAETPKMFHWGNKMEDPYSVSNMRLAFKELMKNSESSLSKAGIAETQIVPTHLHLKFIPKNDEELDLLEADSVLDVVPIPFNYDLENFDGVYRDPECPIGQPTYQYSVVKVDYKLPDVEYEVLDSLFMLDGSESEYNGISKSMTTYRFWHALEYEALRLTDNLADYVPVSLSKRYRPSGTVSFVVGSDTIPVPNAKVHVNFSTHSHSCFTNEDGTFTISGHFAGKVHYHVYFKNSYMNVFERNLPYDKYDAASYGGRSSNPCNDFRINTPIKKAYATTLKAGYYFAKSNSPITKDIGRVMKMCVYDDGSDSTWMKFYNDCNTVSIVNYSSVFPNKRYEAIPKYKINYGAALNAIGAILLMNDGKGNHLVSEYNTYLQEGWRIAVEYFMTQDIFDYYQPKGYFSNRIIVDLIDDNNSLGDKVSGCTMLEIEKQLQNIVSITDKEKQWDTFKANLKKGKTTTMQKNIDALFEYWKDKL